MSYIDLISYLSIDYKLQAIKADIYVRPRQLLDRSDKMRNTKAIIHSWPTMVSDKMKLTPIMKAVKGIIRFIGVDDTAVNSKPNFRQFIGTFCVFRPKAILWRLFVDNEPVKE